MKKHIPNSITLLNLSCGILSVIISLNPDVSKFFVSCVGAEANYIAAALIILGALFDFCDGFSARILNAYSPLGKELDSLADLVTFGFAPAAIISSLIPNLMLSLVPFVIVLFSALRLAKFNVDTRQTTSFIGLPTPANAIFFIGLIFLPDYINTVMLIILSVVFSFLLISEVPMFSLKFKSAKWSNNKIQFIFLAACVVLLAVAQLQAISLIILLYILLSIGNYFVGSKKDLV